MLQQDIGLKSATEVGLSFLGIKVMTVAERPVESLLLRKKYWIALTISTPIIF